MSYLAFIENGTSDSGKTKRWRVTAANPQPGDPAIGNVRWYGPWRKYVFQAEYAIFDAECMREIADFTEDETKKHYKKVEVPTLPKE